MNLQQKLISALSSKEVFTITGLEFAQSVNVIKSPTIQRDHAARVASGKVDYFSVFRPLAHDHVHVGFYTGPSIGEYETGNFYLIDGNTRRHFYRSAISDKAMSEKFPSVIDIMEKPFYVRVVEFTRLADMDATYNCFDNPDQVKTAKDNMYSAANVSGIENTKVFEKLTSCINKLTRLEGKRKQLQQDGINDIGIRKAQINMLGGSEKVEEAMQFALLCKPHATASELQRLVMFYFYAEKEQNAAELREVLKNAYHDDTTHAMNEKSSSGMTPMDYLATVLKIGSQTPLLSRAGGNSSIMYADVMMHAAKAEVQSSDARQDWGNYDFSNPYTFAIDAIKTNFDAKVCVKASRANLVELAK